MYELESSLKKIAHGTGIAMAGLFGGLLLQFLAKLIVARYGLEANYGIFSLALMVLNFAMILSCLGLQEGATRYIAYSLGKNDRDGIGKSITGTLLLATAASVIISFALFFSAGIIASGIFHNPELTVALKLFAIGVPFFTLINIFAAIFRGFSRVIPHVIFQIILPNICFLIFLLTIILVGLPFVLVFYVYLAALIITFIASLAYTLKELKQFTVFAIRKVDTAVIKELLAFSLPLMGTFMLSVSTLHIDTFALGYFKTVEEVGLYSAAYPLAYFIYIPLAAFQMIYIPVVTGLYSQNLIAELRRTYTVSTKWLVSLTLPVFLVFCLFPDAVLNLMFGQAFVSASTALCILSAGFMICNLFGPTYAMLMVLGASRFLMWAFLGSASLNLVASIALIPTMGIVGAAIASAISLALVVITMELKIYLLCKAQPFSKNLLKPLVASILLALLFQLVFRHFVTVTGWMLPLLFILYCAIYGVALVFTRSFDREDIAVLLYLEKMGGLNAEPIKKILRKYVNV